MSLSAVFSTSRDPAPANSRYGRTEQRLASDVVTTFAKAGSAERGSTRSTSLRGDRDRPRIPASLVQEGAVRVMS